MSFFLLQPNRRLHSLKRKVPACVPEFPELNIEPLSIDPLNAFKMKQGFVERTLTQDTLIEFLTHYPELPDEIDLNGALSDYAPTLIIEASAANSESVGPSELTLGEFTIHIDGIAQLRHLEL